MDAMKDPTCAERLPAALRGRLDDFRTMTARDDPDEAQPENVESGDDELPPLSEYPLGASIRYAIRIELSTGGPADYLEAIVDPDGAVASITYHFADWFDHAEQRLRDGGEFEAAEAFIQALYGGDLSELGEYMKS